MRPEFSSSLSLTDSKNVTSQLQEPASKRAMAIFSKMDLNDDGRVTKEEFMQCCLEDDNMINLLTPPG